MMSNPENKSIAVLWGIALFCLLYTFIAIKLHASKEVVTEFGCLLLLLGQMCSHMMFKMWHIKDGSL